MAGKEKSSEREKETDIGSTESDADDAAERVHVSGQVPETLSERIELLSEAIREIDNAIETRKALTDRFRKQIEKEICDVRYHLGYLQPPWRAGFQPKLEFLRLSLHKSLTSRKKDRRSEELKYWEDILGLVKEKRKLLDEYKILVGTKKRISEDE